MIKGRSLRMISLVPKNKTTIWILDSQQVYKIYFHQTICYIVTHYIYNYVYYLLQYESVYGVSFVWLYFIMLIGFGSIFMLNLLLGVLTTYVIDI